MSLIQDLEDLKMYGEPSVSLVTKVLSELSAVDSGVKSKSAAKLALKMLLNNNNPILHNPGFSKGSTIKGLVHQAISSLS